MSKEDTVPESLTYGVIESNHNSYDYIKLSTDQSSGSMTATASGGDGFQTVISALKVCNLSRSRIKLDYTCPDGGVGVFNWVPKLTHIFENVQLMPESFSSLIDMTKANIVQRVVAPYTTKKEDLDNYDLYSNGGSKNGRFLRKSNSLVTDVGAVRFDNTDSTSNYDEIQYCEPGTADTEDPVLSIDMPLSSLKHTFYEPDRNVVFPTNTTIRFDFTATNKIYWTGSSGTDPTATAAAGAGDVAITNLEFHLCVETDPQIIKDTLEKFKTTGLKCPFEYVRIQTKSETSSTSKSLSTGLNSGDGKFLKRVYNVVAHTTTTGPNAFNIDNTAAAKYSKVRTNINSVYIQNTELDVSKGADYAYMYNKGYFDKSCIFNQAIFNYNSVLVDLFEKNSLCDRKGIYHNIEQGVPNVNLTHEVQYTTASAAHTLYKIFVFSKTLLLHADGLKYI
jgi:hypothetical protein